MPLLTIDNVAQKAVFNGKICELVNNVNLIERHICRNYYKIVPQILII